MIKKLLFLTILAIVFMFVGCKKSTKQENTPKAAVEFRLVHVNNYALVSQSIEKQNFTPPVGYELLSYNNGVQVQKLFVSKQIEMDGKNIIEAYILKSQFSNKYDIIVTLNNEGAQDFRNLTRKNIGRQLVIIVDGKILIATYIAETIKSRRLQISRDLELEEAKNIAKSLGYDDSPSFLGKLFPSIFK